MVGLLSESLHLHYTRKTNIQTQPRQNSKDLELAKRFAEKKARELLAETPNGFRKDGQPCKRRKTEPLIINLVTLRGRRPD
jgi:hypothetical protein